MLDNYNYNIKTEDIKRWGKFGINLLSEVLEEVNGRNITYPKAYIEKVLEEKFESTGKQIEKIRGQKKEYILKS
ncbi:hypothetical protein [Pseudogracilibacillus auburnensis]|uniref:hypothetical protein n=1 Tax=Pseudogracilibacillus auburnensis TaxID=1494959 RepID=UPI001A96223B|nr:hypothetical protein [Pseudogracilibacillus auburnensis]MBO1001629.1 hypothetical protein [Pseudogracilibacillus auburnensis]